MVMTANFAMNILISGSLNQLWSLINTQQLIVMMPLFQVVLPANAGLFFKAVMSIAAFDFYDFTDAVHMLFEVEPTDPIDSHFEAIGFESQYLLVNMGSLFIGYIFYAMMLFFITPTARCCKKKCNCCVKFSKKTRRDTYWGSLLTLLNESYVILTVCVLINIRIFSLESRGLAAMSFLSAFFLAFLILVPIIFISKLMSSFKLLDQKKYR